MAKKKEVKCRIGNGLKMAIILILILQLAIVGHLVSNHIEENRPRYEYETLHIELNNTNDYTDIDGEVIDYLCDENVEFSNHGDAYYASTISMVGISYPFSEWERRGYGQCLIKIRRVIDASLGLGEQDE